MLGGRDGLDAFPDAGGIYCGVRQQLLERGPIDEIDLHIVPVLLGDGIRLFDNPGGASVRLELLNGDDRSAAVNVRYHPVSTRWVERTLVTPVEPVV